MKLVSFFLVFSASVFCSNFMYSQSYEEMEKVLVGTFEIESTKVTFTKVIEVDGVSATELYERVLPFFSYHYKNNESSIQMEEKEKLFVISRGIYKDVTRGYNSMFGYSYFSTAEHVLRIDFKDGKLRVMITTDIVKEFKSKGYNETFLLFDIYPAVPRENEKKLSSSEKKELKIFYGLNNKIKSTFSSIEKFALSNLKADEW